MARTLDQIITELNGVYDPQKQNVSSQIGTLDPQMQAEQQGLEAQKRDSFDQITSQANRRGLFYSGLPIQEEQRYTGQQFLPAVANLHAKYAQQKFNLQDALDKINIDQRNQAYGIQQGEKDLELKRQLADEAAARDAASKASGVGGLDFGSLLGGGGQGAPPAANPYAAHLMDSNPYSVFNVLRDANNAFFGGKASYGQLASWAEQQMGQKIGNGTAADLALRNLFLGTDLNTGGQGITPQQQAAINAAPATNYSLKPTPKPGVSLSFPAGASLMDAISRFARRP